MPISSIPVLRIILHLLRTNFSHVIVHIHGAIMTVLADALAASTQTLAERWHIVLAGAGAFYLVNKAIYRRFFHPLAQVPGPFLPAVTRLYAWYYNVPREGKFFKEVERLHQVYGTCILCMAVHTR